jgi:RNA polymerase sigma-70 factor (ECF subfamily)
MPATSSPRSFVTLAASWLSANRLYRVVLCAARGLTQPPLNLQTEEVLGAVVVRLLKALREARPRTVREFFALAGQHMRWELNDLARRSDNQPVAVELREGQLPAPRGAESARALTSAPRGQF